MKRTRETNGVCYTPEEGTRGFCVVEEDREREGGNNAHGPFYVEFSGKLL